MPGRWYSHHPPRSGASECRCARGSTDRWSRPFFLNLGWKGGAQVKSSRSQRYEYDRANSCALVLSLSRYDFAALIITTAQTEMVGLAERAAVWARLNARSRQEIVGPAHIAARTRGFLLRCWHTYTS